MVSEDLKISDFNYLTVDSKQESTFPNFILQFLATYDKKCAHGQSQDKC